jgi:hypothetical protein
MSEDEEWSTKKLEPKRKPEMRDLVYTTLYTIWSYILLYSVGTLPHIFYPETITAIPVNDSTRDPRPKWLRKLRPMTTWIKKRVDIIQTRIDEWSKNRKSSVRLTKARSKSGRSIKGFGGSRTTNDKIGTLVWKWDDSDGKTHRLVIPKSFYVPGGSVRLLSPQHWAQTQNDVKSIQGTGSQTVANKCTLFWEQKKYSIEIPLKRSENVATFNLSPGFTRYSAFYAEAGFSADEELESPIITHPSQMVSDDEGSTQEQEDDAKMEEQDLACQPLGSDFKLNGPSSSRMRRTNNQPIWLR